MRAKHCKYAHLNILTVFEAITLIVLSIIYPEQKIKNKPTLCKLLEVGKPFKMISINYSRPLNFKNLNKQLFVEVVFNFYGKLSRYLILTSIYFTDP